MQTFHEARINLLGKAGAAAYEVQMLRNHICACAYHEAAHMVVALERGWAISIGTIAQTKRTGGSVFLDSNPRHESPEVLGLFHAAGGAGERRAAAYCLQHPEITDAINVENLTLINHAADESGFSARTDEDAVCDRVLNEQLAPPIVNHFRPVVDDFEAGCVDRAIVFLRDPRVWGRVKALADRMMSIGFVTGEEIPGIIEAAKPVGWEDDAFGPWLTTGERQSRADFLAWAEHGEAGEMNMAAKMNDSVD